MLQNGLSILKLKTHAQSIACYILISALCCMFAGNTSATTYYVDALAGNDNNAGTSAAEAWKGITRVNNATFNPGDKIVFKRGERWHGSLVIPTSGTPENPVTFGAYGDDTGPLPLIDCSAPITGDWTEVQAKIYSTPLPGRPGVLLYREEPWPAITTLKFARVPSSLASGAILLQLDDMYTNLWVTSKTTNTVSGITFFTFNEGKNVYVRQLEQGREKQYGSSLGSPKPTTSPGSLTEAGHWYWHDHTLYVYSDTPPGSLVAAGRLPYAIRSLDKHDLVIRDIAVRGCNEGGIFLMNTTGATINNVHISSTGNLGHKTGLLLFNSSGNTIRNNVIDSVLTNGIAVYAEGGSSRNNTISGNTVVNPGSAGINLSSGGDPGSVSTNIIEGNTITGANHLSYDGAGIYTLQAGSNTIRANTIRNCGTARLRSAGIMADGGTLPLTIDANTIENNSIGGIAVSDSGHRIIDNRLNNNGASSWDSAQIVFFPVTANAADCTVRNNTMQARGNQKLFLVIRNPQFTGDTPHHIDNNRYNSEADTPFCWSDSWNCSKWLDFKAWKKISGQDANSRYSHAQNRQGKAFAD